MEVEGDLGTPLPPPGHQPLQQRVGVAALGRQVRARQ